MKCFTSLTNNVNSIVLNQTTQFVNTLSAVRLYGGRRSLKKIC